MKYFNILFAAMLLFTFSSCEEKCIKIPEFIAEDTGRVVLIEEITGVSCPNCPAGAATIKELQGLFPGRVISVAYHSPPVFVQLRPTSIYDFKRDQAQEIQEFVGDAFGKPSATFNREPQPAVSDFKWVGSIDSWAGYLQTELEKSTAFGLLVETTYNSDTREVDITVTGTPVVSNENEYRLHVLVTESHMIDAQLDQDTDILEYEHNHVFHQLISGGVVGDAFASGIQNNVSITKNYNFTLPTNSDEEPVPWVPENCEIVAFITNADGTVEQAAIAYVVE